MVITPDDEKLIETGIKAAVSEGLRPFTDLMTKLFGPAAEEIGLGLAAGWTAWRIKRQIRFWQQIQRTIAAAGYDPSPVPPKMLLPIIQNASIEDNDDLQDRWAALLANAANPGADVAVLPAFVEILKQLSSIEAKLLDDIYSRQVETPGANVYFIPYTSQPDFYKAYCAIIGNNSVESGQQNPNQEKEFNVLISNFLRLRLIEYAPQLIQFTERDLPPAPQIRPENLMFTNLGAAFMKACRPPARKPETARAQE